MIIVGAGLSGLLAARMLANNNDVNIIERQEKLPNNHSALLRFRTDAVSKAIDIPFHKVEINKAIYSDEKIRNYVTIADMNAYSLRVTGKVSSRSIVDLTPGERWIAPDDLISQLSTNVLRNCSIAYDTAFVFNEQPTISTIPMPDLMRILKYPKAPKFEYRSIWTINCYIEDCDVYQTLYFPYIYDCLPFPYRATITGNRLTLEFEFEPKIESHINIKSILNLLYIPVNYTDVEVKQQPYGKIVSIDEIERKSFIVWASDTHNIYSLGRFATWRPGVLLDDIIHDIEVIKMFLLHRNNYNRRKHYT